MIACHVTYKIDPAKRETHMMRTASRRNSSVYLGAILNLLHSKHC